MFSHPIRIACAAGFSLLLAACASDNSMQHRSMPAGPSVISGSGTTTIPGPGPSASPAVAGPAGCAGPITEYQQVIDADAESGHLNPGVYNRVTTDLGAVKQACAAGREAEARSQLAAVKARYGYR